MTQSHMILHRTTKHLVINNELTSGKDYKSRKRSQQNVAEMTHYLLNAVQNIG